MFKWFKSLFSRKNKFVPKIEFVEVDKPCIPTKRRPSAVKISLVCDNCKREFSAYPSEYPQLSFASHNDGVRPLIYCNGTRFDCPYRTKNDKVIPVTECPIIKPVGDFDWTDKDLEDALKD